MRRFGAGYAVGRPPSVARASDGASDSYGAATAAAAAAAGCGWHALRHACRPTPPLCHAGAHSGVPARHQLANSADGLLAPSDGGGSVAR